MRKRFYVGVKRSGKREMFSEETKVVAESKLHISYSNIIGPFRTKRGAEIMRDRGHGLTLMDAERKAREER